MRITFTLDRPGRVVFVVRGPAPSCRASGRFSVQGDRGVNHVRFTGRVGRRALPDGTYRITARTRGRPPSRPVVVVVGEHRLTHGFSCAAGSSSDPFVEILVTFGADAGPGVAGHVTAASTRSGSRKAAKADSSGVLPAVRERLRKVPEALPELAIPPSGSPSSIVAFVALSVLLLSGLALVLYVIRFLRRPHAT